MSMKTYCAFTACKQPVINSDEHEEHLTAPLMPGRSMLACSWIPMPFRMIRREPSLNAPEQVTSYRNTHTGADDTHWTRALLDRSEAQTSLTWPCPCLSRSTTHMSTIGPRLVKVSITATYEPWSLLSTFSCTHTQTPRWLLQTRHHHRTVMNLRLPTLTSWESPSLDPTNTTPLSRYVRHSAMEV